MTKDRSDQGQSNAPALPDRIAQRLATLSPAERKVAEFLRNQPEEIMFASAEEIGELTGTSDATVVRTAKALGYSGLPELKRQISRAATRHLRPALRLHQRIEKAGSAAETLVDRVFAEATERLGETHRLTDPVAFARATDLLAEAREVFAFGIGPSGLVAGYLAMRLRRLGHAARGTDHTGFRLADELLPVKSGDTVVIYAPGRLLPDIEAILAHAASVGARTVLVTDSLAPVLGDRVDVCLPASHSPSGFTGEVLSAIVTTDALVLAMATRDETRSTATSDLLNAIRRRLLGNNPDVYVPKRRTRRRP